ncbi:MAG: 3-dehydroquinate dehydratase [Coriobacteriia bacterium]|nr:3-dehydroquinate dehydratase [Coriobacteriia bacterium]
MKLLVLNGPNLNLLGTREPKIYGTMTLDALQREVAEYALELSERRAARADEGAEPDKGDGPFCQVELFFYQSNHEGILVDTIQNAQRNYQGIIYNPAAHTHYSIALRDAIAAISIPVIEVHLTDITAREPFRATSVMADVCAGRCLGKGVESYKEAVDLLVGIIDGR